MLIIEAARRLGAEPSRAVVVEDAIAGVEAGHAGRFGCVIGVDRSGHAQALRDVGAD
jgi:beta-phosphoglucomutase-like phosphatase (HAD superfamily)